MAKKRKIETTKTKSPKENPILLIDESIRKFKSSEELLHLADRLFQKDPKVCIGQFFREIESTKHPFSTFTIFFTI